MRLANTDDVSLAIVGRHGSGKTSILRLVCGEIERRGRADLEVIDVQMWPYETARAAVIGIIDRLVEALGEHVNVVGLRGIPAAYAEAISAAPGGSVLLAALRRQTDQPADMLAAIDEIARAIGIRYVVWIEDLERFATGGASDEKLGLVRALLHGLHRLPSFTVITATTELSEGLDLDKIARYVERVPSLPPSVAANICEAFISQWRKQAINRGCKQVDEPIEWTRNEEVYRYTKALIGSQAFDIPSALDQILTTPRALKQALRRCDEAWQQLAGEIDLDEMFAMSIVRESRPRAYAIIERYLDRLREAPGTRPKETASPMEGLRGDLQRELVGEPAAVIEAIGALVNEVFFGYGRKRLQGLGIRRDHVDYWERFSALPQLPERRRDQHVLRALLDGSLDEAIEVLEDTDYGGGATVHLATQIPWERLVTFLVPIVRGRIAQPSRRGGFVALWNAIRKHEGIRSSVADLQAPISEAIDICTQECALSVLVDFEEDVFTDQRTGDVRALLPSSLNAALQQHARDRFVRDVRDSRKLIASLRSAERETLVRCVWGAGAVEARRHLDAAEQPFADWTTMATVILDALDMDPDTMAPQVAPMVFSQVDKYGEAWRFQSDVCAARFENVSRVATAIARSTATTPYIRAIHAALEPWFAVAERER